MTQAQVRTLQRQLGALLESHQGRDLSEFGRYADDPIGFIREVLKGDPWSMQVEIGELVRDHPLVTVRSCNGAGKDWLAARVALWWVYARRGYVLCTAPTERQLKAVVMGEIRTAFHAAQDLPGELFELALRVDRDERTGLLAFTSSEASRLTGFHAPRLLVLMTESQGCQDFAWESMHANLTGSESRFLAVGNPLAPTGRFYAASRSDDWQSVRISAEMHPNVVEGREVIPGGVTRRFVERIAREYGAGSGIYKGRVEGEFPEQAEDGLVTVEMLDAAAARCDRLLAEHGNAEPTAALDVARLGADASCLVVRRGPVVVGIKIWRKMTTTELLARVQEDLRGFGFRPAREEWRPEGRRGWLNEATRKVGARGRIVVDEVGLGAAALDPLRAAGWNAVGFNGGRRARQDKRFCNARSESYFHLRKLLEDGAIGFPHDEDLRTELLVTTWKPDSSGRVALESKDALSDRLGRSPDRADSLAMCFYDYRSAHAPPKLEPLHYSN